MSGPSTRLVLLGPQTPDPDVDRVLAELRDPGRVAVVSAGWREGEEDDSGIHGALGRESVNLRLWGRAERVWRADPELTRGHRTLQRRVRALRHVYNIRLAPAMDAWKQVLEHDGDPVVLEPEREHALETVRALDRHHGRRLGELREGFLRDYDPFRRTAVVQEREELARALEGVGVIVVGGGHVPVLLNRLRLFGMAEHFAGRTVVAVSGGAMALADRVVFFHDSPPWGPGYPEMGEIGLGLFRGVIPLPEASARLRLDDPGRVLRFALRFSPDVPLVLDPGARLDWDGAWRPRNARRLSEEGTVEEWRGAA